MIFEDYVTTIWAQKHPFATMIKEETDEDKLDTFCLQRIDWMEYQVRNNYVDEINKLEISSTLENIIDYFALRLISASREQRCFAVPGSLIESLFKICSESLAVSKEELEKMDNLLFKRVASVFKMLFDEKTMEFDAILEKTLSWFNFRQEFYNKTQIGFSPAEYYIPSNFYKSFRDEMLRLRNTNFNATVGFAEYSIWVYNNAKDLQRTYMMGDLLNFNRFAIQCCRNALVAAQSNGYFESIEPIKNKIRSIQLDLVSVPTVFISYNWGKQSLVDEIQKCISSFVIIKRDVSSIGFGDSITEFMNTIREEDFALIVISDAYLKSDNCIYELTTLFKDKGADNFNKKVLFLICDDAKSIYTVDGRGKYMEFWDNRYKELVALKDHIMPESSVEITKSIRTVSFIRLQLGEFLEYAKSVNNFGEKEAIEIISSSIEKVTLDGKIGRNIVEDFFVTMRDSAADYRRKSED